jgi:tryptophan-rich sensory protein
MKPWITYLLCFIVTAFWMLLRLDGGRYNIGSYVFAGLVFILAVVLITQYKKTTKEKIVIFLFSILFSVAGLLIGAAVFGLICASIGKIGG